MPSKLPKWLSSFFFLSPGGNALDGFGPRRDRLAAALLEERDAQINTGTFILKFKIKGDNTYHFAFSPISFFFPLNFSKISLLPK
jgi:hypothetical protein